MKKRHVTDLLLDAINGGQVEFGKPIYMLEGKHPIIGRVWLVDGGTLDWLDQDNPNADYDSYIVAWYGDPYDMFEKKDPLNSRNGKYRSLSSLTKKDSEVTDDFLAHFFSASFGMLARVSTHRWDK